MKLSNKTDQIPLLDLQRIYCLIDAHVSSLCEIKKEKMEQYQEFLKIMYPIQQIACNIKYS